MASVSSYDYAVAIEDTDIDFMGHVNNASYLKWVQAATIGHWKCLAPPDAVEAYLWVAVKHEITYRKPAFRVDALVATVQLQHIRRESAFYESTIQRGAKFSRP